MDIKRTSGKRVSGSQRDSFTAESNQTTIRKPWKSLATVVFGLFLSAPGLTQAQYKFTTIDVPNTTATQANGNSPNAIAGQFDDTLGTHGFVSKNGVFTTINAPGAVGFTAINGINALGQLAGTYIDSVKTFHAFFDNNGYFTTLDPQNATRSQGGFINAKGQVVGTYRGIFQTGDTSLTRHGFIWSNGTFTTFNVPGNDPVLGTVAFGINDVGAVVGDYVDAKSGNRHGFLRSSKGDFATFDVPGAVITVGEGINNRGTIVGAYLDGNLLTHGFVLKNPVFDFITGFLKSGIFMTVDVPGAVDEPGAMHGTQINSINAQGEIVGGYFVPDTPNEDVEHGFIGIPAPQGQGLTLAPGVTSEGASKGLMFR